jgi:probable HAF family extracellular repeat protein
VAFWNLLFSSFAWLTTARRLLFARYRICKHGFGPPRRTLQQLTYAVSVMPVAAMGIRFAVFLHLMTSALFRTNMLRAVVITTVLACITSTLSAQNAPAKYVVQDLGVIDGYSSTATAINDAGVVVGWIDSTTHSNRAALAIDGGAFEYVPGLDATSAAAGINAFGQLAGYVASATSPGELHAMRYTGGVAEDLGSFGGNSFGYGINRYGQVAGWSFAPGFSSTRAFVATPGEPLLDLGTLGGGAQPQSFASGINDAGQVAGHSVTSTGRWHAFRYTPGLGLQDLGTPAGADSFAERINGSGQVVGRISSSAGIHAFRSTDGTGIQDLHTIAGASSSWAFDVNDAGMVVGMFFMSGAPRALVYTDAEGMVDLNTRIDPASGWVLTAALGINSAGQIVGQGTFQGQTAPRAFKLTPQMDVMPPAIAAAATSPSILWPANLEMMPVAVTVDVTDNVDPAPRCRIVTATSSEETDDGAIQVTGDLTLRLRAERNGSGIGRTYQIAIACSDASGNTAGTSVEVSVPHDRSGG